ncbi:hypothetical protein PG995_009469 [Apiospora arundinis]
MTIVEDPLRSENSGRTPVMTRGAGRPEAKRAAIRDTKRSEACRQSRLLPIVSCRTGSIQVL